MKAKPTQAYVNRITLTFFPPHPSVLPHSGDTLASAPRCSYEVLGNYRLRSPGESPSGKSRGRADPQDQHMIIHPTLNHGSLTTV